MTKSEEKYGQKIPYDPLWRGPMQYARSPTDQIWLYAFLIYMVLYIVGAIYGLAIGNLDEFAAPTDYVGRTCGLDLEVQKKPYLLYTDLKTCTRKDELCESPNVCVSECPTENFIYKRDQADSLDKIKEKIFCTTDINITSISSFDQLDILISHKKCTKWYLKSEPLIGRCLAFNAWEGHENETITSDELYWTRKNIKEEEYFLKTLYIDISSSMCPISIAIICGGVIAILYVALLKWFAVPFFYTSICIFCIFLVYGIYYCCVEYASSKSGQIMFILVLLVLLIIGVIIAVVYFRKKIYLACQLVKESSKAVMHLSLSLIYPIIPWLLYILVIIFSALVFLSLLTITQSNYEIEKLDNGNADGCACSNNYTASLVDGMSCDPIVFNKECKANGKPCLFLQCHLSSKTNPRYLYVFHSINILGFYWLLFFISGFEYMTLGGAFATWYWTYDKNNVSNRALIQSTTVTLRYHLGSISIGSLILTITQIIRLIFQGLETRFREANNVVGGGFMCCFKYFFDLLNSLLSLLNYNAYIMCAIHAKNFCRSAKDAFNLIMRNVVNVVVVNTVTDWLFVVSKLLVTSLAVGGVALYYTLNNMTEDSELFISILVATALGTYIISSVFIEVQSIAANTIFLCFIEDTERNDGSEEKPYYMSNTLKRLLYK